MTGRGAARAGTRPDLTRSLPPAPPASLDPYLDAAARCFTRFGTSHTSVQDVANELCVNRTTVYRQVGNVDTLLRLLVLRELHRLLDTVPPTGGAGGLTPDDVVDGLATLIAAIRAHPVMAKVLDDERDLVGSWLTTRPEIFGAVAAVIAPALSGAMEAGTLARRDPLVVAEWIARITASAVVAPPAGDLRPFLAEMIVPALAPPSTAQKSRRSSGATPRSSS